MAHTQKRINIAYPIISTIILLFSITACFIWEYYAGWFMLLLLFPSMVAVCRYWDKYFNSNCKEVG